MRPTMHRLSDKLKPREPESLFAHGSNAFKEDRPASDTARNALVLVVIGVLVFGAAQYAMKSTKPGDGKALPMETANHAGYAR